MVGPDGTIRCRAGVQARTRRQNFDVFDFAPEPEHMTAVDALHDGIRVLDHPLVFTGTQLAGQTG